MNVYTGFIRNSQKLEKVASAHHPVSGLGNRGASGQEDSTFGHTWKGTTVVINAAPAARGRGSAEKNFSGEGKVRYFHRSHGYVTIPFAKTHQKLYT